MTIDLGQVRVNTVALVKLQFLSRIITFILNAIVVRFTGPAVLGVVTIKLELLYNGVLFLSREGLRLALLRFTPHPPSGEQKAGIAIPWLVKSCHMSFLALPFSVPVLLLMAVAYGFSLPSDILDSRSVVSYCAALGLYAFCALIELASEPAFIFITHQQLLSDRVRVESRALTLRATVIIVGILGAKLFIKPTSDIALALFVFPIAQMVYATTVAWGFWSILFQQVPGLQWQMILPVPFKHFKFEPAVLAHAKQATSQVLLKFVLSQGDMWIVGLTLPLQDQGVYAVVTNYGSLICRIILQPIEEAGLVFFSQALSSLNSQNEQSQSSNHKLALNYLALVLKFDCLLGILALTYGPAMARPLIGFFLGARWLATQMPTALASYCFLIPVMSVSGILEAFINATMVKSWARLYQAVSVAISVTFIISSVILSRQLGPTGLILANILNFTLRAVFGIYYLGRIPAGAPSLSAFSKQVLSFKPQLYSYFGLLMTIITGLCLSDGAKSLTSPRSVIIASTLPLTAATLYYTEGSLLALLKGGFKREKAE